MTRVSREMWLDEGLSLLKQGGVEQVRIEPLCDRLNVTKGSFYHHFKNHDAYLADLLTHWEEKYTSRFIEEAEKGVSVHDRFERLTQQVLAATDDPEIHIRTWALTHQPAEETVRRVDGRRIDYLTQLYIGLAYQPEKAVIIARAIYTTLIGSQYIVPNLNGAELLELFSHIGGQSTATR